MVRAGDMSKTKFPFGILANVARTKKSKTACILTAKCMSIKQLAGRVCVRPNSKVRFIQLKFNYWSKE